MNYWKEIQIAAAGTFCGSFLASFVIDIGDYKYKKDWLKNNGVSKEELSQIKSSLQTTNNRIYNIERKQNKFY